MPALGQEGDPEGSDPEWREIVQPPAGGPDRTRLQPETVHEGAECRGLPCIGAPEERDHLAVAHGQIELVEADLVAGRNAPAVEQRLRGMVGAA